jgi:hypothetical protein
MAKRHPAQDFFASRLAASGVTEEQARLSGIVPATRDEALRLYKKLTANITDLGMLIRYPDQPNACRYRCNWERKPKYLQPKGSGSLLFFPKVKELDWEKVLTSDLPIYIVEGELKSLALCLNGFAAIGIGGVNSFVRHGVIHPSLVKYFKDRVVYVVFDSDAENNPNVAVAASQLQVAITDAGGTPMLIRIPFIEGDEYDVDKTGVDTFLRVRGTRAFDELDKEDFELAKRMMDFNSRYVICESPTSVIRIPKQTVEPENLRQWAPERFYNVIESVGEVSVEDGVNKDKTIKYKKVQASKHWLQKYAGRNLVNCMTFRPGLVGVEPERYITENVERKLNLWSGWNAEPVQDDGLVEPFLELMRHVYSSEPDKALRELLLEFTLSWFAYPIQHPGARLEQALAFVGIQGSGKTLPFKLYGQLYGPSFLVVEERQLQSNFNSWIANRLFILGEEITGDNNSRKYANSLKTMITGEDVLINTKYVPEYKLPNYANLAFTSNECDAFFLNATDRRFGIHRTPEVQLFDPKGLGLEKVKYLDEKWRKDQRCLNALMHYLLHYEIDEKVYKPKGMNPPRTEAKKHMELMSMNAAQRWLKKFTEDEDKRLNSFSGKVRTLFRSEDLFKEFDTDEKSKHGMSDRAFTNALVDRFYKPLNYPVDGCKVRTTSTGVDRKYNTMKLNLWAIQPQYGGPERTLNKTSAAAIWNQENTK